MGPFDDSHFFFFLILLHNTVLNNDELLYNAQYVRICVQLYLHVLINLSLICTLEGGLQL